MRHAAAPLRVHRGDGIITLRRCMIASHFCPSVVFLEAKTSRSLDRNSVHVLLSHSTKHLLL